MSDVPFYRTQLGHTYYGHTLPKLVRELERLNTNLERLVALVGTQQTGSPTNRTPDEAQDENAR
jgi:hypothetical protein